MTYYDMATITSAEASIIESESSAIGLIPLGSLEQYGPHLPLATDSLVRLRMLGVFLRTEASLVTSSFNGN